MSSEHNWNYRVVSTRTNCLIIKEVFYCDDRIVSWSNAASFPYGNNMAELTEDCAKLLLALSKPILKEIKQEDGTVMLKEI